MPWVTISKKGTKYHYYDSKNNKPILLDIHGFGVTALSHFKNSTFPLEKHFRLIIPELPAHGVLKDSIKSLDLEYLSTYIENFTKILKINNFDIIGRSVGGIIALNLENRAKFKFKHIIIIESPIVEYEKAFSQLFKYASNLVIKLPEFMITSFNHKLILHSIKNVHISKNVLSKSKAKFIYAEKDMYLSQNNIDLLKKLDKPIYFSKYVAHFNIDMNKTVINLMLKTLNEK